MVIDIIHVLHVVVRAKDHLLVCANRYRPKTFELAFERMQPETGHIHIGHGAGCVELRENIAQFDGVFGYHAARVVVFMKAFQSFVAN